LVLLLFSGQWRFAFSFVGIIYFFALLLAKPSQKYILYFFRKPANIFLFFALLLNNGLNLQLINLVLVMLLQQLLIMCNINF